MTCPLCISAARKLQPDEELHCAHCGALLTEPAPRAVRAPARPRAELTVYRGGDAPTPKHAEDELPPERVCCLEGPEQRDMRRLLAALRPVLRSSEFQCADGIAAIDYGQVRVDGGVHDWEPRVLAGSGAARTAPADAVDTFLDELEARNAEASATLRWLRAHGREDAPLAHTYAELGASMADEVQQAKWAKRPDARREGAVVLGRRLTREAMAAWWESWRCEW